MLAVGGFRVTPTDGPSARATGAALMRVTVKTTAAASTNRINRAAAKLRFAVRLRGLPGRPENEIFACHQNSFWTSERASPPSSPRGRDNSRLRPTDPLVPAI